MRCYDAYEKYKTACEKKDCKYFIKNLETCQCCAIIAARSGPMTLENIGSALGRTKMRISQIQHSVIKKIKKHVEQPL